MEPRPRHFLRAYRKKARLTLEAVAAKADTTHATLSRVETGKMPYNQHLLERLAAIYSEALGSPITDADLLGRDPNVPDPLLGLPGEAMEEVARYAEYLKGRKTS